MEKSIDSLGYLVRKLETGLNWRIVRSVSELQILTKASYIMLIFVPILAGLWPGVRLIANQHNKAVLEATAIMKQSAEIFNKNGNNFLERLEKLNDEIKKGSELPGPVIIEVKELLNSAQSSVNAIHSQVARFKDDFTPKTIEQPKLPWAWATGFFAALFVIIAHFAYQLFAPEIVRKHTLDEFIANRKEDYVKHPTDIAVSRANEYTSTTAGVRDQEIDIYEFKQFLKNNYDRINFTDLESEIKSMTRSKRKSIIDYMNKEIAINSSTYQDKFGDIYKIINRIDSEIDSKDGTEINISILTLIEKGAKIEYLSMAKKNFFIITITGLMYCFGLYLIITIVFEQANAVIYTAGWHSPLNMFSR